MSVSFEAESPLEVRTKAPAAAGGALSRLRPAAGDAAGARSRLHAAVENGASRRPSLDFVAEIGEIGRLRADGAAAGEIARSVGDATSSTHQDIARGRRTEIDALNGYVARRGAELGVATPVNEALHALVALRERSSR